LISILISVDEETRIALLEDGFLIEYFIERPHVKDIVGDIYKGRVERILHGMGAAFVDIGLGKNGFLPLKDVNRSIGVGEEIIVQVSREGKDLKGPRLTMKVGLPGRYILLLPGSDRVGISRRIDRPSERKRLKELISGSLPEGFGAVVRTAAKYATDDGILEELGELLSLWASILENFNSVPTPSLLYSEPSLVRRVLRDWFSPEVKEICSDSKEVLKEVEEVLSRWGEDLSRIKLLYHNVPGVSLFEAYGVEDELRQLLSRKVSLLCGGEIVIDRTEALTVIDVNTSSFVGEGSFERTALRTNLEAAREIGRQLRLRGIGGIVIIDFIDMKSERNKELVLKELYSELEKDRREVEVHSFSPLGLLELTREREGPDLVDRLGMTCPYCRGKGWVLSEETLMMDIKRRFKKFIASNSFEIIEIIVSPKMKEPLEKVKEDWERSYGRKIVVLEDADLPFEDFRLRGRA